MYNSDWFETKWTPYFPVLWLQAVGATKPVAQTAIFLGFSRTVTFSGRLWLRVWFRLVSNQVNVILTMHDSDWFQTGSRLRGASHSVVLLSRSPTSAQLPPTSSLFTSRLRKLPFSYKKWFSWFHFKKYVININSNNLYLNFQKRSMHWMIKKLKETT